MSSCFDFFFELSRGLGDEFCQRESSRLWDRFLVLERDLKVSDAGELGRFLPQPLAEFVERADVGDMSFLNPSECGRADSDLFRGSPNPHVSPSP